MAKDTSKNTLAPNRSALAGHTKETKRTNVIPNPNTVPDPQQAVGIATDDTVRMLPI